MRLGLVICLAALALGIIAQPARADAPFPYVPASQSGSSGGTVTSHIVNLSASVNGDMILVCLGFSGTPTVTWPNGWVSLKSLANGATITLDCRYEFSSGSAAGTVTITTGSSVASAYFSYIIRGALAGTTPNSASLTGTSANPNPTAVTGSITENCLYIVPLMWNTGTVSVSAYPTNYFGNQVTARWNNAGGTGIASATRDLRIDSEDPVSFTLSSSTAFVSYTVAVRPASTTATDYTPLWVVIVIFGFLVLVGFRMPFLHIFAGIVGLFLGYQIYTFTTDMPTSAIVVGVSLILFLDGVLRAV